MNNVTDYLRSIEDDFALGNLEPKLWGFDREWQIGHEELCDLFVIEADIVIPGNGE